MEKSIPERLVAVVTVLERLAADVEIIRQGVAALQPTLPEACEVQRCLLATQEAALERMSIGLGMVQATVASLGEIRSHAETIRKETEALIAVKNSLDTVLLTVSRPENWRPVALERAMNRFTACTARIGKATVKLLQ